MEAVLAQKKRVRSPVGSGIFYPEDRKETLRLIKSFGLDQCTGGHAQAIIAPHGAWSFSGALAANAFSCAAGRSDEIKHVVILGPIHDKREEGLFLSNSHSFYTPLGKILVDRSISEELEFCGSYIETNDIPHLGEHSIEILLPFVKYCFPRASIVPVLMGQPADEYIKDLAQALNTVISHILDETLIVVSCNLSCSNDRAKARNSAEKCLRLFSGKDSRALTSAVLDGSLNACGGGLMASLLESGLLDGKSSCSAADYMISAEGSENNTVFYSAVSFE